MDQQIRNIIDKQQNHELLKYTDYSKICHLKESNEIHDLFYWEELRKVKRKILLNKILHFIRIACFCLYTAFFIYIGVLIKTDQNETSALDQQMIEAYKETPRAQAERAIAEGDYDAAKQILDDTLAEHPDYWLYDTYAELYVAMGENDNAVSILTDTIYNRFHVENMVSTENSLYKVLKEIPSESLTTSATERQKCLADCDTYIEKYNDVNELIEQESYYSALQICDELKADGAYDNYLYWYYYKCYVGLKAYDECEGYLKDLYGKQTSVTDFRYPDDSSIEQLLDELEKLTGGK